MEPTEITFKVYMTGKENGNLIKNVIVKALYARHAAYFAEQQNPEYVWYDIRVVG